MAVVLKDSGGEKFYAKSFYAKSFLAFIKLVSAVGFISIGFASDSRADAEKISCAETPFQSAEPGDNCKVVRQVSTTYQTDPVDLYVLQGTKNGVVRTHTLCAAKARSYCKAVPVEGLKFWLEEKIFLKKFENWSDPRNFGNGMAQDFDFNAKFFCTAYVRYDQATDSGYKYWLVGSVCTPKDRPDRDVALRTAADEFTSFKK